MSKRYGIQSECKFVFFKRICAVKADRKGQNQKELSVRRGELIEIEDSSKKWWRARNFHGETGHVPHNIVEEVEIEYRPNVCRKFNSISYFNMLLFVIIIVMLPLCIYIMSISFSISISISISSLFSVLVVVLSSYYVCKLLFHFIIPSKIKIVCSTTRTYVRMSFSL